MDDWFERLQSKLNPLRFPDMDPGFALLVREILQINHPGMVDFYVDAGGLIQGRYEAEAEARILGERTRLARTWHDFITSIEAGMEPEEREDAKVFLDCCLRHFRSQAPDRKPYFEARVKQILEENLIIAALCEQCPKAAKG